MAGKTAVARTRAARLGAAGAAVLGACALVTITLAPASNADTPVPPAITSASTTTMLVGSAGTFTVSASGSPVPTIAESGALPSGVTFAGGVLSGTPAAAAAGIYSLTFDASNGTPPDAVQFFTLVVDAVPAITSATKATFTEAVAGSFTVTATGTPAPTFSETGALPSGVALTSLGTLSGTPVAGSAGSYPVTVNASNGIGFATQSFTLVVATVPTITSDATTTFTIGTAGSFGVAATGSPTPTITATGALPSGVTLSSAGLLSGTPAAGTAGSYPVTFTAANGASTSAKQAFTLVVEGPPTITSANKAGFVAGRVNTFKVTGTGYPSVAFSETGTLPPNVSFDAATGMLSSTSSLAATGSYPISFGASDGTAPDASQAFTLVVGIPPRITSPSSATFVVGASSSVTIVSTGNPTPTLSAAGRLPGGLTFKDNGDGTATLSGTPVAKSRGGLNRLTITATNAVGSLAERFTVVVRTTPVFKTASTATFTVGVTASFVVKAVAYPKCSLQVISGALPSGLGFSDLGNGTALISGTPGPGTAGTYPLIFQAANALTTAGQDFTLTIGP